MCGRKVWQDKMMFLTFPSTKPLINEDVQPQLLNEYSGKVVSPLHWCAYECVGRARQFLPRYTVGGTSIQYLWKCLWIALRVEKHSLGNPTFPGDDSNLSIPKHV